MGTTAQVRVRSKGAIQQNIPMVRRQLRHDACAYGCSRNTANFRMLYVPYTGAGACSPRPDGGQVDAVSTGPRPSYSKFARGACAHWPHWGERQTCGVTPTTSLTELDSRLQFAHGPDCLSRGNARGVVTDYARRHRQRQRSKGRANDAPLPAVPCSTLDAPEFGCYWSEDAAKLRACAADRAASSRWARCSSPAVDLGSEELPARNRRIEGAQILRHNYWKETVRLRPAARPNKRLSAKRSKPACECLARME